MTPSEFPLGRVIAMREGKLTVRLEGLPTGGCGGCVQAGACGIGRLAALRQPGASHLDVVLEAEEAPALRPGDAVRLGAPRAGLPLIALLGYVFPVFAMLPGAALGQFLHGDGALPTLFALAAFLLALFLIRRIVARWPGFFSPAVSLIEISSPSSPSSLSAFSFSDTEQQHHEH
ncbi:MAG: SoxR reducing system RseC family protein [Zoogloeaceae bacterium]|jgi:positive regulator of sigma E activity|nr:SoxR reducing system RseC family protein [Zoogloeaceae bacterium]